MEKLKYISLFSGIEAASVAWEPLGWEPIAFSEIEPFPCALLDQRFPQVSNLGDITKIDWSSYCGKADVIVGGSPCQSFSIAGNREGLKGESGLMFEYIRAVREVLPRYFVWENVPGALSSEGGAAFAQLLREMDVIGYGLAWRVLDAQFFGVAQRRRRIFLVGCLGNAGRAAQILFDGESMRWDYPSSRDKRKSLAECAKRRLGGLRSTLARRGSGDDNLNCLPFNPTQVTSRANGSNPQWGDPCHTLSATDRPPHVVCMADGNANAAIDEDLSGTLKVGGEPPIACCAVDVRNMRLGNDVSGTLQAKSSGGYSLNYQNPVLVEVESNYAIRRLMPLECERLQGFPDGWTAIEIKGKPASDGARYKALGNSMAVPVMAWIGKRIARFDA